MRGKRFNRGDMRIIAILLLMLLGHCATEVKKEDLVVLKNKEIKKFPPNEIIRLSDDSSCDSLIEKTVNDIRENRTSGGNGDIIVTKSKSGDCFFYHLNESAKKDSESFSEKIVDDCSRKYTSCKKLALVKIKN